MHICKRATLFNEASSPLHLSYVRGWQLSFGHNVHISCLLFLRYIFLAWMRETDSSLDRGPNKQEMLQGSPMLNSNFQVNIELSIGHEWN